MKSQVRAKEGAILDRQRIQSAYENPDSTLGAGFRPLLRDKELAQSALVNASSVLLAHQKAGNTNTLSLERQVAALTRTCELAAAYAAQVGTGLRDADMRIQKAHVEIHAARKALSAFLSIEDAWLAAQLDLPNPKR